MEVPDGFAEEFGLAIQLGRLWHQYPAARLSVEQAADNAYKASVIIPGGPATAGHSGKALHAMSRALVHLGLDTDLTDYP